MNSLFLNLYYLYIIQGQIKHTIRCISPGTIFLIVYYSYFAYLAQLKTLKAAFAININGINRHHKTHMFKS